MSTEDDIIVADLEEAIEPVEPDTGDDGFLTELMRSQFRKKLDLVSEIEDHAASLEEAMALKLETFSSHEVTLKFREISMFQNSVLDTPATFDNSLFVVNGDERLITSFLFGNPTFQKLLAMALSSGKPKTGSGQLSEGEARLFLLFMDLLSTALFETVDVIPEFGIPKKPVAMEQVEFLQIARDQELICFIFDLELDGVSDAFVLMSPLSVFDGKHTSPAVEDEEEESPEEIAWRNALFNQVEGLKMPLTVELATAEMLVSDIEKFEVGQELHLPIRTENLTVNADLIYPMMQGELQISGKKMHLRVTGGAE